MKAIILAAGVGSRLNPLTNNKPKCLVNVAGSPILSYQLKAFIKAGIKNINILAGYKGEQVLFFVNEFKKDFPDVNINVIKNEVFDKTNNMYSLFLAKDKLKGEEFCLINGDVAIDTEIVTEIVNNPKKDLIAVEKGSYNEESMKVVVNANNEIIDISKQIQKSDAWGNSIDLYKFSKESSQILFDEAERIIVQNKNLNEWTEVAIQRLLQNKKLITHPFDIMNKKWVEIDNYDDLALADKIFSEFDRSLKSKKIVFIDLDGTVYLGDQSIPGADKFVEYLNNNDIQYYFFSNNSSKSKQGYAEKLKKYNIQTTSDKVILSTDGLIRYLLKNNLKNTYVMGTSAMKNYLSQNDIIVNSQSPELVIIGYDTELTYDKLKQACIHINNGIEFVATHSDVVCPTSEGNIPDIGSFINMIKTTTSKEPKKVFGKPNKEMLEFILLNDKVSPSDVVLIGDRMYTDGALSTNINCDFICVLSGETKREEVENIATAPTLIAKNLLDIIK